MGYDDRSQGSVVVCAAERVVVKLNRAARRGERLGLLCIAGGTSAVAIGFLVWLARPYVHPAAGLLGWIAVSVSPVRVL